MIFPEIMGVKILKKMLRLGVGFVFFWGVFLVSQFCWSETAYVKDSLLITFRTGPSTGHTVIARLLSGQPVEVLGTEGDWSHVRLVEDGEATKEGWVLSQYLITRLPWKMQAETALKESAEFKQKAADLERELSESIRRGQELSTQLENTAATLAQLRKEHESLKEGAAGYLELKDTHTTTQSELETTQLALKQLTERYEKLKASDRWKWIGTGGGIFFLALIIGIVVGHKQKRRRSSYY